MKDSKQVCEYSLPHTQLEFMHEINNKEGENVQSKLGKDGNERALGAINMELTHR